MIKTKIYINKKQIDLKEDISIPLNFSIADIREPDKRSTTWSKTVTLPGSSFNNNLFSNLWNVNTNIISTGTTNFAPSFNPNLKAEAEITYNEASQFKGICQLLNVNVTNNYEIEYEVAFFGELQNVYQTFKNAYLRDLDLSAYDHTYTLYNQQLSWSKPIGIGYVYPHIDYGYQLNNRFKVTEIFPAIYVKQIIDKMFSEAGFTYSSEFFNSEIFKRLVLPYNGSSVLYLTDLQVKNRTMKASKTSTQNILNNGQPAPASENMIGAAFNYRLTFNDDTNPPNFDTGNNWSDIDGGANLQTYTAPKSGTYVLSAYVTLNVTHFPSTSTASIGQGALKIGELRIEKNPLSQNRQLIAMVSFGLTTDTNGSSLGNYFVVPTTITSGSTSDTKDGTLSITCYLNQGDILQVRHANTGMPTGVTSPLNGSVINPFIYKDGSTKQPISTSSYIRVNYLSGSYFKVELSDSKLQEGDTVEINNVLPDKIKQSDFFDSIIKAFNLFVEADKSKTNNLLIEPRPTFYSSGLTRDWSYKLDESKETKIVPMGDINGKTYLFTYKEDKDYFNNDYKMTYNENYGQKKYEINNDFLKGEVRNELIFSPTPLVDTIGHDRVISKIYSLNTNGAINPTASNIRMLYYGGLKSTSYPWQHIATSGTTIRNDYAYAGHLNDVANPTFDLNFGMPNQVYYTPTKYTGNNLYNKYWRDYIEQIADKDSKLFVGYFLINEWDIQNLDFRDKFYFKNEYWRLNKIVDYDAMSNQATKCEFIKLKEY